MADCKLDGAAEAAPLVELAGQSPAITGVGFSFRRLPGLAAVRNLVADGAIGTVHSFTAWYNADYGASPDTPFSWRYAKDTAGAGALIDIGTHAIDTVQHVVAPVRRVISATLTTAITRRPIPGSTDFGTVDTDDIALLTVELENGAVGQIHVNRIATGIPNSLGIQVHGSGGHATPAGARVSGSRRRGLRAAPSSRGSRRRCGPFRSWRFRRSSPRSPVVYARSARPG